MQVSASANTGVNIHTGESASVNTGVNINASVSFCKYRCKYTSAAPCNAHGHCDQIFAKVGDGRLQQRKPAGRFEKNNPNLGNRVLAYTDWK